MEPHDAFDPTLLHDGHDSAGLLDRELSRGRWKPSSFWPDSESHPDDLDPTTGPCLTARANTAIGRINQASFVGSGA